MDQRLGYGSKLARVFTKRHEWRRWSGPRTEVTAAVNLASTELEKWSGKPSAVRFRITYSNQLTETSDDPKASAINSRPGRIFA